MTLVNVKLVELSSKSSVHSVFLKSIVPKIYENIKIKVSGNESERGKVLEFMKSIKLNKVVEAFIMRPAGYIFGKNER